MKSYLIHIQEPPYNSSVGMETVELALALAAFGQKVSLLFSGAGETHLNANDPSKLHRKDFTKAYEGLELFDIKNVYRGSLDNVAELIDNHDVVLNYA